MCLEYQKILQNMHVESGKKIADNREAARLCSNGTRSPEATYTWPWATENIFQVAQPGDGFFDLQSKS